MLLSTLAADALVWLRTYQSIVGKTVDEYARIYRQFDAHLRAEGLHDDVRSFTGETVESFVAALAARGCKASTIRHKLSALSSLGKYGMRTKVAGRVLLTENPAQTFVWPRAQRPRQEFLYPDELRAFLACPCAPHESIPRDLFVDTGLRRAELVRANVEDFVQLPDGAVLWTTVKGRGRQDERTPIPISSPVAATLRVWLEARPAWNPKRGPEPLLTTSCGDRWRDTALGEAMARLGVRAGITRIRTYPHRLRRTSNIVARSAGLDSMTRSALLNHTDPSTIKQYDAVIPGELAAARERARTVGLVRYLGTGEISTGPDDSVTGVDSSGPDAMRDTA